MLLVGVTGGIGMGKSTVAAYLTERGERVLDTDTIAQRLVEPGAPALEEIRAEFGNGVLNGECLDRRKLAEIVFASETRRQMLERILHPRIRESWKNAAGEWAASGTTRAFIVIPLLYETAAESEFDWVICVSCGSASQAERLASRGWSHDEAQRRIQSQWPIERKVDRANGVIWNEGPVDVCWKQTTRLLEVIGGRA
jgi:dephospho-CoA kinase